MAMDKQQQKLWMFWVKYRRGKPCAYPMCLPHAHTRKALVYDYKKSRMKKSNGFF